MGIEDSTGGASRILWGDRLPVLSPSILNACKPGVRCVLVATNGTWRYTLQEHPFSLVPGARAETLCSMVRAESLRSWDVISRLTD
jgi:hypothetical protein